MEKGPLKIIYIQPIYTYEHVGLYFFKPEIHTFMCNLLIKFLNVGNQLIVNILKTRNGPTLYKLKKYWLANSRHVDILVSKVCLEILKSAFSSVTWVRIIIYDDEGK